MSRNGAAARAPSLTSWTLPGCSTTNTRCGSPGAAVARTGESKSVATVVACTAAWAAPGSRAAVVSSANRASVHARRGDITWRYTQLRAELLHTALVRVLIGAPALELGAVAYAVAADVIEGDLDDQLRSQPLPDELLVGLPAAGLAGAALVGPVGLQRLDELALLLGGEPRRVTDDVQVVVVVVEAEDQRPDRAWLLPEAERLHDHVRSAHALDLQHPDPLARAVLRARLLGDHALGVAREPGAGAVAVV